MLSVSDSDSKLEGTFEETMQAETPPIGFLFSRKSLAETPQRGDLANVL